MSEQNKPAAPVPQPIRENVDFGESVQRRQVNDSDTTVSFRVPITPSPIRPPDRDKND